MRNEVLLQKCHSNLWTSSKLHAKNHIEIYNKKLLLMISTGNSINIAFNFAKKKELEITWLERVFQPSHSFFYQNNHQYFNFFWFSGLRIFCFRFIFLIDFMRYESQSLSYITQKTKNTSSQLLHLERWWKLWDQWSLENQRCLPFFMKFLPQTEGAVWDFHGRHILHYIQFRVENMWPLFV